MGSDRLTDGSFFFFFHAGFHACILMNAGMCNGPSGGGGSQACLECQSCLMSSLSYPQVALWVQTSAAEWAPVQVRAMYSIFTMRVCLLSQ